MQEGVQKMRSDYADSEFAVSTCSGITAACSSSSKIPNNIE